MTEIYLTDDQISRIRALIATGNNERKNYSDVYQAVSDMLPDSKVKLWLDGASLANAGRGVFAELIREYSRRQMELRGIEYTDKLMQDASNRVAIKALNDILNPERRGSDGRWKFPDLKSIAEKDATGVGEVLFGTLGRDSAGGVNNAGWSGTILFQPLVKMRPTG